MKESDKKKIGEAYLRLHSKENKQLKLYKEYSDVMLKVRMRMRNDIKRVFREVNADGDSDNDR